MKEQTSKKAAKFVQQFIYDLWQRRVPYRDLIIWKTLTKPVDEYAVKESHVEAAKMLKEKGWRLTVGDKVGYVVVVGSGRPYERLNLTFLLLTMRQTLNITCPSRLCQLRLEFLKASA